MRAVLERLPVRPGRQPSTAAALWSLCSTSSSGGPQRLQCTATRYGNRSSSQVTCLRRPPPGDASRCQRLTSASAVPAAG